MKRDGISSFLVSEPLRTKDRQQFSISRIECPRCHEYRTINFQANTRIEAFRLALAIHLVELCGDCERKINGLPVIERKAFDESLRAFKSPKIMVQEGDKLRPISQGESEKIIKDAKYQRAMDSIEFPWRWFGVERQDKIPHFQCGCLECIPESKYDEIADTIVRRIMDKYERMYADKFAVCPLYRVIEIWE